MSDSTDDKVRLTTLPEEILSNVARRLDSSDDLFNLRLTCRDIESKVLHEFATQYIGTKCFIFSSLSLRSLEGIAGSAKLRQYLRNIFFLTGHFPGFKRSCCTVPSTRQKAAYAPYATDQRALHDQGTDRKLLAEAFKQLPSLRTLMLVDHAKLLPDDVQWHGLNTFRRKTGYNVYTYPTASELYSGLDSTQTYYDWLSHVFGTMIRAVADSGITTITKIGTQTISKTNSGEFALSPLLDMKFSDATITKLTSTFANVEHLELQFRTQSLLSGGQNPTGDIARAGRRVRKFTQTLQNITNLDLSFDGGPAANDICASVLQGFQLGKVSAFQLHGVSVACATLAKAVCSLTSARDITFDTVDLRDGSWVPILQALDKLPLLDHLHIFYATSAGQKTYFLEQVDPNSPSMADPMSAWPFGFPPTADAGNGDGQWEDTDGQSDDEEPPELLPLGGEDNEEPPDLIPLGEEAGEESYYPAVQDDSSSSIVAEASLATEDEPGANRCQFYNEDFKAPCDHNLERGYFVCLQGDEVHAQLPRLVKEHNIAGQDATGDMLDLFGAGGPAGGLVAAMAAAPGAMPPPAQVANPNFAGPAGAQALQNAITQAFQGIGLGPLNGAAPANGAALPTGPPPGGWGAQGNPFPLGGAPFPLGGPPFPLGGAPLPLFQSFGPNGPISNAPAGGLAQGQTVPTTGTAMGGPAAQQQQHQEATAEVEQEVGHGALDDVE